MDFAALAGMMSGAGGPNLGGMAGGSRGAGAGGASGSSNPAELKVHADHMWKFLDELASSDPEGYKKFIAGQMEEVAAEKKRAAETEALFTPKPAFVIYTRQTSPKPERTIYLNICSSPQVPPLQTKDRQPAKGHEPMGDILIPLSVGAIKADTHEGAAVFTSDCVFHPSVVQRATTDLSFKLFMLELALQHLEEDEKVVLHRAYKFESPTKPYIGNNGAPQQQKTEAELAREKFIAQMKAEREEKIKNMKTQAAANIVMPSLSKANAAKQQLEEESLQELKLRPDQPQAGKDGVKKKVLIEDLTPDEGEDASMLEVKPQPAAPKPSSSASSKPAISLASTTKSTAATAAATHPSSSASSTSAASSSASAAAASVIAESAYSSKASVALSSDDLFSSLANIPMEDTPSSWPYGSSSASMQSTSSLASVINNSKVTPVYSMSVTNGQLQISIQLPFVASVSEVEVDVSRLQLKLESQHYSLTLTFPQPIDDNASAAKFVKKQLTLKISAPLA